MFLGLRTFFIPIIAMVASPSVFAHGGGGTTEHKEEPKKVELRRAALKADALDSLEAERLTQEKKVAEDVVLIHCKLSEFNNCRGIEVSLHDLSGKIIARAHTGMSGLVGFEGLKSKTNYLAKIESEKYQGEAQVQTSRVWPLIGERR